tara:strand:- start:2077 stop:2559 length:483 start_codon:yes stop_codon:yes gene_type:complete
MKSHFENAPFFTHQFFTLDEFSDILIEAACTIHRLPRAGPRGYASGWPDWVRDAQLAYGYNAETVSLGPPSSKEIDRLDKVLNAIWASDPVDAKLCMVVAFSAQNNGWPRSRGPQWKRTARGMGIHSDTLRTRHKAATERLWRAGIALRQKKEKRATGAL